MTPEKKHRRRMKGLQHKQNQENIHAIDDNRYNEKEDIKHMEYDNDYIYRKRATVRLIYNNQQGQTNDDSTNKHFSSNTQKP